jgi:hypothetical protein
MARWLRIVVSMVNPEMIYPPGHPRQEHRYTCSRCSTYSKLGNNCLQEIIFVLSPFLSHSFLHIPSPLVLIFHFSPNNSTKLFLFFFNFYITCFTATLSTTTTFSTFKPYFSSFHLVVVVDDDSNNITDLLCDVSRS